MQRTQIGIPSLVRIKPGAMARVGVYLARMRASRVALLSSHGLPASILERFVASLSAEGIALVHHTVVEDASYEVATQLAPQLPTHGLALVGLGGGRALDVAKYVAHLASLPYVAVPTSLSNDGFASPSASLTVESRRRSFGCSLPVGVVVDTAICLDAPTPLWLSGIGDVAAKATAIVDWKLAFHARAEPIDDLAALLSDATVFQLVGRTTRDLEGERLLATALLLNGVAMEMAGSTRPASGSEHLVSHALDRYASRPRLHGLQVGMAAYLVSAFQRGSRERVEKLLVGTGFFDAIRADPFVRDEWLDAFRHAPEMKHDFHTVLTGRDDVLTRVATMIDEDPLLGGCFQ
ncbi:MAG: iron-containing alcohol dehydrogenase family protein [Sandaracinus sp.]|nr:iron-containing alcohol dehydrogenase family protein [Sandaracinus sp.]